MLGSLLEKLANESRARQKLGQAVLDRIIADIDGDEFVPHMTQENSVSRTLTELRELQSQGIGINTIIHQKGEDILPGYTAWFHNVASWVIRHLMLRNTRQYFDLHAEQSTIENLIDAHKDPNKAIMLLTHHIDHIDWIALELIRLKYGLPASLVPGDVYPDPVLRLMGFYPIERDKFRAKSLDRLYGYYQAVLEEVILTGNLQNLILTHAHGGGRAYHGGLYPMGRVASGMLNVACQIQIHNPEFEILIGIIGHSHAYVPNAPILIKRHYGLEFSIHGKEYGLIQQAVRGTKILAQHNRDLGLDLRIISTLAGPISLKELMETEVINDPAELLEKAIEEVTVMTEQAILPQGIHLSAYGITQLYPYNRDDAKVYRISIQEVINQMERGINELAKKGLNIDHHIRNAAPETIFEQNLPYLRALGVNVEEQFLEMGHEPHILIQYYGNLVHDLLNTRKLRTSKHKRNHD